MLKELVMPKVAAGKGKGSAVVTQTKKEPVAKKRKTIHSEVTSEVCHEITADRAKEILSWEEEGEKVKFGNDYSHELKAITGRKIRLTNNVTNRHIYKTQIETLKQEHLLNRWRLNGETIIIGKTGLVLNGQHTLISLILIAEDWHANELTHAYWKTEPTMAKVIVYGIDEKDEVVNTMDTCKPRSLTDVIDRSEFFRKETYKARYEMSRMCDYAIKLLWHRMGCADAFRVRKTHSEALAFLGSHPKILECVKHIYKEDTDKKISRCIPPGTAAGLLYLMGCSDTPSDSYHLQDNPAEDHLDWGRWSDACDFFVQIAGGSARVEQLRIAFANLLRNENASLPEKQALIIKAWAAYRDDKPINSKALFVSYITDGDGLKVLAEHPTVGGIDLGDSGPVTAKIGDQTEKDIEKVSKAKKSKTTSNAKRKASRKGVNWAKDDSGWVRKPGDDTYFATLTTDPMDCADGISRVMVSADDGDWEIETDLLHMTETNGG